MFGRCPEPPARERAGPCDDEPVTSTATMAEARSAAAFSLPFRTWLPLPPVGVAPPSEGVLNQRFRARLARLNGRSQPDFACLAVLAFGVRGGRGSVLAFKILGPLEVVRDGEALPLGPAKQRALVACLLLHPNETVSVDRLIDELWGPQPPERADRNLHQYVFRLRKVLDDHGRPVLITRAPGYRLELGEGDRRRRRRSSNGASGRPARSSRAGPRRRSQLLERGLAMWRGPALADFAYQGFAETSARRLEELRASAEEARIEALLALGRERDAITEAESLVRRFPLREHVRALQMLALYRAGRQSEALNAYQDGPEGARGRARDRPRARAPVARGGDPAAGRGPAAPPGRRAARDLLDRDLASRGRGRRDTPTATRDHAVGAAGRGLLVGGTVVLVALAHPDRRGRAARRAGAARVTERPDGRAGERGGVAPRLARGVVRRFRRTGNQRILGGVQTSTGFLVFGSRRKGSRSGREPGSGDGGVDGVPTAVETGRESSFEGEGNQRATDAVVFRGGTVVLLGTSEYGRNFDAAAWIRPVADPRSGNARVSGAGAAEGAGSEDP